MGPSETNPLLAIRFRIPFDRIHAADVEPATASLLRDARTRLEAIAAQDGERTWENTMRALDAFTEPLDYAMGVVRHLESVATYPELRAAFNAVQPEVSAFYSGIALHALSLIHILSNIDVIEQHLAVNLFGSLKVSRAFLPALKRSKGAIVNTLSLMALAPLPVSYTHLDVYKRQSMSWLTLSASSGTAPSTVSVSVSVAGLSAGTYTGAIQVTATGASNSPLSIPVTLVVAAQPASLLVAPQALTFQYAAGGAVPAAQAVSIANGGGGSFSWTASNNAFWTALSATSGNVPGTLNISVNPANLAAGSYTTLVTISASDSSVTPAPVSVTLVVQGSQPAGTVTAVANGGSFQPGFASAGWITIYGSNLSQLTYTWQAGDFVNGMLPTSLEGVSVTVNGIPAYVEYISPSQINALAPDDATVGPVQVQVTTAQQTSNAVTAQKGQFAPAFFTIGGAYVAAEHTDYSPVSYTHLSFWILDDVGPLRQWSAQTEGSDAVLFQPRPMARVRFPDEVNKRQPAGENPPAGAMLSYYLKTGSKDEVKIEISDTEGTLLKLSLIHI